MKHVCVTDTIIANFYLHTRACTHTYTHIDKNTRTHAVFPLATHNIHQPSFLPNTIIRERRIGPSGDAVQLLTNRWQCRRIWSIRWGDDAMTSAERRRRRRSPTLRNANPDDLNGRRRHDFDCRRQNAEERQPYWMCRGKLGEKKSVGDEITAEHGRKRNGKLDRSVQ